MKFGARTPRNVAAVALSALAAFVLCSHRTYAAAPDADSAALERAYAAEIRPLVLRHCQKCHNAERTEADVDLTLFATWGDVRKHPQTWQKVGEMLESGQMPPKEAPQPTDDERTRLKSWVHGYLKMEAQARAGDPGRVVLRRLSNAEYTYTLRDLTGIESLDPAREFPVDGAAGEGFTNTGNALVISPALVTKYLDAAKEVAGHAVLLPDGIRFSPSATRQDWTNETLDRIRTFYRRFTDPRGGEKVNLQGVVFETNDGGRLPIQKYLEVTLIERDALRNGTKTIDAAAREHGLNAKYSGTLWDTLRQSQDSLLLDGLRLRWEKSKPEDAAALAAEIGARQKDLWRFTTVGHIGKVGGPKKWLESVNPLIAKQEIRYKIPASADTNEVVLSLVTTDAGDGNEHDSVVWLRPRLVAPGRPDLMLRDVREVTRDLIARRDRTFANAAKYLDAADVAAAAQGTSDVDKLAAERGVEMDVLRAWLDYLGIGSGGAVNIEGHFTKTMNGSSGYDFIKGWGTPETPQLVTNPSDQHVRIPGNMKPHGVAVHPSPKLLVATGWRSPVTARVDVEAQIVHAHPECGNGVTWSLELRRGATRQRLAAGTASGNNKGKAGPIKDLAVQTGDVVSLVIGARDGNHSCDLTAIDLKLTSTGEAGKTWDLAADVSGDPLSGNPHVDRFGNAGVWHFYTEPDKGGSDPGPVIPAASLLAKWQTASTPPERTALAAEVQKLLTSKPPAPEDKSPDALLYRQLASLGGPLFGGALRNRTATKTGSTAPERAPSEAGAADKPAWGLDPTLFGKHPSGLSLDAESLCVRAPSVIEIRLPADLAAGCELVTTGVLDPQEGSEGSAQVQVVPGKVENASGLVSSGTTVTVAGGQWTSNNRQVSFSTPVLVNDGTRAKQRFEKYFDDFRMLFPAALCYTKIVPVDEVVTLTLFYREDDQLCRLMLDEQEHAQLDRLWDELHYISHDALTLVDALEQLIQYATQDADPKVFEPLRGPFNERAAAFRQRLTDTEPKHLGALLDIAAQAYRRPQSDAEAKDLRALYRSLRDQEIPHDEAIRLTLARVLVAPSFLYRIEKPVPGAGQGPVSDAELANRLSYFLWSSQPDAELLAVAAEGRLHDPGVLWQQAQRMLKDPKTRRLATEFGCQWLHIYNFDHLDEKSERHFPSFTGLRSAMYEESVRFLTDLFQNDGSVLGVLDSDHTFLNEELAEHYGIPDVKGPEWRRVDGMKRFTRGGILAHSTTLATQSGASRTSPILRGNWISEVLLGERLPRPPKGVPPLPDDEAATDGLTVRQLVEQHSTNPKCAVCHQRIDAFGFSLEGFDAIGRRREKDLGDRAIDARVRVMDGAQFDGLDGLRDYLVTVRRDAFLRQFCKKLLGYALGRSVQLSDEPLLAQMQGRLAARDYHVSAALEAIILSRQFREIRGQQTAYDD